ncbi:sperm microtubule inner protein 11 [Danio rerio]|uniref:Sperm microtubule inner protein 11 n=1 Tax=Danio rerio TaxID=7955 RepID=A0AB32TDA3_DANRE
MAFFGITYLGYQNPFGDRMLHSTQNKPDARDPSDLHLVSQNRYKDHLITRHAQRSPKDLYRVPVTENQRYGWWIPTGGMKNQEPWTQTRHFPRKNSEMTKFVNEMSVTNPDFSLF